jgi:hypothetical protein
MINQSEDGDSASGLLESYVFSVVLHPRSAGPFGCSIASVGATNMNNDEFRVISGAAGSTAVKGGAGRPVRRVASLASGVVLLFAAGLSRAADLKPETIQDWDAYVEAVDARNQERLLPGRTFLSSDEIPGRTEKLRRGEIIVSQIGPHVPLKIHSGLIHDWIGAAFIPNVTLTDVLPVVRNYDRYKDFYHPNVIDSRRIGSTESEDEFSMVLMNKSVVTKIALDSEYRSSFTRLDDHRWYSVSETTRIQEIADFDTPSQHTLAENHGTGLIWRLRSITRFEERDGGVYIELEAIALSREVPAALRWFVDPIVRRVSKSSLFASLQQTETAVRSVSASLSTSPADYPACRTCVAAGPAPATDTGRSFR